MQQSRRHTVRTSRHGHVVGVEREFEDVTRFEIRRHVSRKTKVDSIPPCRNLPTGWCTLNSPVPPIDLEGRSWGRYGSKNQDRRRCLPGNGSRKAPFRPSEGAVSIPDGTTWPPTKTSMDGIHIRTYPCNSILTPRIPFGSGPRPSSIYSRSPNATMEHPGTRHDPNQPT